MDYQEKLEKIKGMKKYFWIAFFVSFILLLLSTLLCIIFHDAQLQVAEKFFGMDSENYSEIVVFLLGLWKILIIQFTLIPAIALCLLEKVCCCKCSK